MPSDSNHNPPAITPKQRRAFQIVAAALFIAFALWVLLWLPWRPESAHSRAVKAGLADLPVSFSGSSENLSRTSVLATLESPISKGSSALWCTSLALAWKHMEEDIIKAPLILAGAEDICQRLTAAKMPDICADDKYVAAGAVRDGIVSRIREEVQKRFPDAPPLRDPPEGEDVYFAYAYLQVAVRFTHVFPTSEAPLGFQEGGTNATKQICAFGIPESASGEGLETYRKQVHLLFHDEDEFAVDLDQGSTPYQIILARLHQPESLRQALDALTKKTKSAKGAKNGLDGEAILLVPFMNWNIEHVFKELSNKPIAGAFSAAKSLEFVQSLRFKLDPSGAVLASGASIGMDWANGHLKLIFERPFLLVVKSRAQELPICAFWIHNAELLQSWLPKKKGG